MSFNQSFPIKPYPLQAGGNVTQADVEAILRGFGSPAQENPSEYAAYLFRTFLENPNCLPEVRSSAAAAVAGHDAQSGAGPHAMRAKALHSALSTYAARDDFYRPAASGVTAYTTADAALTNSFEMTLCDSGAWKQLYGYQQLGAAEWGNVFELCTGSPGGGGMEFYTDSTAIECTVAFGGQDFTVRAWVDGKMVATTLTVTAGTGYLRLVFPSDGVRKVRFESASSYSIWYAFHLQPGRTMWAAERAVKMTVVGDSNAVGGVTPKLSLDGYSYKIGRMLGVDFYNNALGSTGYIAGTNNYGSRFFSTRSGPGSRGSDIIYFQSSTNDMAHTNAAVTTAAKLLWAQARAALPNALIVVGGYFGTSTIDGTRVAAEAAMKAAFDEWADPFSLFIPTVSDLTGIGTTAAPSGTGNNDVYSDDGTHLSPSGGTYMARLIATRIIDGLGALT